MENSAVKKPAGARPAVQEEEEFETPYVKEIREFLRQLLVTEKNLGLYPPYSKVVKQCLDKFYKAAQEALEEAGSIRLSFSPDQILYEDEAVYEEPTRNKSMAFRIHKDGVREVVIHPGLTLQELSDFVMCLRNSQKVEEEEDDFVTLFWEKDASNIQLRLADDFMFSEDLPNVPESRSLISHLNIGRFKIPPEQKERLEEVLKERKADTEGDSTFEITEEEAKSIEDLVEKERAYIPLFDFADILLEVMVRNTDPGSFSRSVKLIRTIIAALIEDLDFERAAFLLKKFSLEGHPGLQEHHRRQLREMLETFGDKDTMLVLETFLKEHDRLAPNHHIFTFMKELPESTAEGFCPFLRYPRHAAAISEVLVHLGKGHVEMYAKYLEDDDPNVVRAMTAVILDVDKEKPLERIARVLRHPDEAVRVQTARLILEKGDASAAKLLLPLLQEESRTLLNVALEFFAKVSHPGAYEALEELIGGRSFDVLDPKRKRLCFKALLNASPSCGLELLSSKVLKRTFCLGAAAREKKTAALQALGSVQAPQARELLERFARKKDSPLGRTAAEALRDMEAAAARKARGEQKHRKMERKVEVARV